MDAFNLGNDLDSIYGNTGDIANNTAATADALDIAEEDLAYLRDIAEREAINRFTTAEISTMKTTFPKMLIWMESWMLGPMTLLKSWKFLKKGCMSNGI